MFHTPAIRAGAFAFASALLIAAAPLWAADAPPQPSPPGGAAEAAFLAENDAAMSKMMTGMTVKPTGDIDRDFALMMVPHHQGAVDMALAELRHGHNEQLRRIAQEIVVEQLQEITAMRLAIGEPPQAPVIAPTQSAQTAAATAPALPSTTAMCRSTRSPAR
jgi:Domain of unknown function (DUF305)